MPQEYRIHRRRSVANAPSLTWLIITFLATALLWTGCKGEQPAEGKSAEQATPNAQTTGQASEPEEGDEADVAPRAEPADTAQEAAQDDASGAPGEAAAEDDAEAQADLAPAAAPEQAGPMLRDGEYGPLPDDIKAILFASEEDATPENLDAVKEENEGKHFLFSDEYHPEKYKDVISNLGGAYVGIGTDQAFFFIGWQRPVIAFLADYDPWVKWMHMGYVAFFHAAETPDAFIAFWEDAKSGRKVIQEYYADHPNLSDIDYVFKKAAHKGRWRHLRMRNTMNKAGIKSYINDQESYDFVRNLVMAGRTRPMMGNLLADKGFVGIAETAKKLGVPVRVLYLSNAEQYWDYNDQYRTNMMSQPIDEKTVVLHTLATKPWNEDYHYAAHSGENFFTWLRAPKTRNIRSIVKRVDIAGPDDIPYTFLERLPKDAPSDPEP